MSAGSSVELTDPRALRALAHPIRLELVGLLRRKGPLTATQAAEHVGESAASCSFHLRQLAKWGLVEEAGGGKGRERPWRATAEMTSWKVHTQEQAEAAAAFSSTVAQRHGDELVRWFARMPAEPPRWQRSQHIGDLTLDLSAAETHELGKKIWELVRSYERERREGDRRVTFLYALFPQAVEP